MDRGDYFKDIAIIYIVFTAMGIATLTADTGVSTTWGIIMPTFFFGTMIGITLYGFIKYKK